MGGVSRELPRAADRSDLRPAVDVRGLVKYFGFGEHKVFALEHIALSVMQNEFFTLLGPSGCGKTTLLRLIAGFEFPSEGSIALDGTDIAPLPPFKRPINTVFQSYALFPHMTVAENIGFGLRMLRRSPADIDTRVREMLKLVQMEDLRDRMPAQLSGGQQQRVALARALAPRPKVLLLDEPLSALDYKLRKDMQIELKRLQGETGITFIFVTHDQEEALTMSDRIAVMSRGRILQVGSPRQIYNEPANRFVANFIGESNFLSGTVSGREGDSTLVATAGGVTIAARRVEGIGAGTAVTLAVRPEHASLRADAVPGALAGVLEHVVFVGTDTYYHLRLQGGQPFSVRAQNLIGTGETFAVGLSLSVIIPRAAAQILGD